ncbi:MAG: serine hydroxymethyltransferase [Archaeoglobus sp.]|jgi:glycine hydroxymethyltransferase|nr:serine hydroxymethyltransferase [Archaeoglobus sp.]
MYSELQKIIKEHNEMMRSSIPLIASENITSALVRKCYLSDFGHRYAEGKVGERYYAGCKFIDEVEKMAIDLTKKLFDAEHVNVQPISGVVANLAAFFALTEPEDIIFSISVPCGGHISHDKISAAGYRGLKVVYYPFDVEEMNIDVDATKKLAKDVKPNLFVLGSSLILRHQPVREIKEIAENLDAYVMFDASHVLGLIAGRVYRNPMKEGADVLTSSTHKTFFGPQRGLILSKKELAKRIDKAVFPGVVSNHHLHSLAGYVVATMEMLEFGEAYAKQVVRNARRLAEKLYDLGYKVLGEKFGFTETHQIAIDVRDLGGGDRVARRLEEVGIIVNKNLMPWDSVDIAQNPSGIRIGVQEVTRLGMKEEEMERIAEFMDMALKDRKDLKEIRKEVKEFRKDFQTVKYSFEESDAYEIC